MATQLPTPTYHGGVGQPLQATTDLGTLVEEAREEHHGRPERHGCKKRGCMRSDRGAKPRRDTHHPCLLIKEPAVPTNHKAHHGRARARRAQVGDTAGTQDLGSRGGT